MVAPVIVYPCVGIEDDELHATPQILPEFNNAQNLTTNKARIFATVDRAHETISDLTHARQLAVMLAALCHAFTDESLTLATLERLKIHTLEGFDVRGQVVSIVREQAKPFEIYQAREQDEALSNGSMRRLAARCELNLLWRVARSQSVDDEQIAACQWFIERARKLNIEHAPPKLLLQGRHLQEMGLKPSPLFGRIIKAIYEMQLDESVMNLEEARAAAEDMIATNMYE